MKRRRRHLVEFTLILLLATFQGLLAFHSHDLSRPPCSHSHAAALESTTDPGSEPCSICKALSGTQADAAAPVDAGTLAPAFQEPHSVAPAPASPPVRRGGPSRAPPAC